MAKTAKLSPQIGIITYYRNGSYGAALQAYALQHYLKQIGYNAKTIRYTNQWPPPLKISDFLRSRSPSSVYNKFLSLLHRKYTDSFADNFIVETVCFESKESLKQGLPEIDVFVCGSDQLWNPWIYETHNSFDDCFFLSFASDSCGKISYAASFGRAELSDKYKSAIKPLLERFDFISVRESSGVHLLADMGIHAEQVLDPSFLLEKESFLKLAEVKKKNGNGILVFILGSDRSIYIPICKKLSGVSGLHCDIISPCMLDIFKNWVKPCYPSVVEWLGMFSQAHFVMTDSFHGTVFSIIFNKPFVLLLRTGGRTGRNNRLINLLETLGLENRMMDGYDAGTVEKIYKTDINWDMINQKLNIEKENSKLFLNNALKGVVPNDAN